MDFPHRHAPKAITVFVVVVVVVVVVITSALLRISDVRGRGCDQLRSPGRGFAGRYAGAVKGGGVDDDVGCDEKRVQGERVGIGKPYHVGGGVDGPDQGSRSGNLFLGIFFVFWRCRSRLFQVPGPRGRAIISLMICDRSPYWASILNF